MGVSIFRDCMKIIREGGGQKRRVGHVFSLFAEGLVVYSNPCRLIVNNEIKHRNYENDNSINILRFNDKVGTPSLILYALPL